MTRNGPFNWALLYFEDHVMEPSDGCRIWPGPKAPSGYVHVTVDGRLRDVHVMACERWYGCAPQGMQVAHSCGNHSCWAGEHLRWATPKANAADRDRHGRTARGASHGMHLLTEEQAIEIRQRLAEAGPGHPGRPRQGERGIQSVLAEEYGVSVTAINNIARGKTWSHLGVD